MTRSTLTLLLLALTAVGCSGTKPIHERGWIGGRYTAVPDRPEGAEPAWDGAVLVTEVYPDTPAQRAGLAQGDVILALDGAPLDGAGDLRERIDDSAPGSARTLTVYRFGERHELALHVGRERYRTYGSLGIGLSLSGTLDLIPTPDFNVLGVARFTHSGHERLELHAPDQRLARHAAGPDDDDDGEPRGVHGKEGWSLWLGVIGVGRHVEVLSQEPVDPETKTARAGHRVR